MCKILFFVTLIIGCQAIEISNSARNGNTELVQYYLFTKGVERPQPLILDDNVISPAIRSTTFDENYRTVFIVHGHKGSWFTTLNPLVKDAFLDIQDENINVIVVDWAMAAEKSYNQAVSSVSNVAQQLNSFIEALNSAVCGSDGNFVRCVTLEELHLVGFNLGAHIVGQAARPFNGLIGRITGLDPSGTNWGFNTLRLRKSDAFYVEVIHTDGTGVLANGIGTALGDVDFFVNGGCSQPGCLTHACSHNRAYELFAASLRVKLTGRRCNSNLQLSLNICDRNSELEFGNNVINKLEGDDSRTGIYRINTSWKLP